MQQTEFDHNIYHGDNCRFYDEYNKCCMLDRIERIIAYFYEEGLNTIKWGERNV